MKVNPLSAEEYVALKTDAGLYRLQYCLKYYVEHNLLTPQACPVGPADRTGAMMFWPFRPHVPHAGETAKE